MKAMTAPQPTNQQLLNAINGLDSRFDTLEGRFDTLKGLVAGIGDTVVGIADNMATRDELQATREDLQKHYLETRKMIGGLDRKFEHMREGLAKAAEAV